MQIKIDPLDKLFSEFIRKRAMNRVHGCERCITWKADWKQLQCSHYIKRRKQSTRFDEDNCNGFCFGCHQYFEENREDYTEWMKVKLGEEAFNMLSARARIVGKSDKELIKLYLIGKIKEMENDNPTRN